METIIEIHVLQNFAPSNLNRDDTGAPKDAFFGGTRRARISSQCFKRAVRQYFDSMVQQGKLADQDVGVRTRRIMESLTLALVKMGRPEEQSQEKVVLALSAIKLKIDKENQKSEYLLFLSKVEIQEVAQIINDKWDIIVSVAEPVEDEKKTTKTKKDKSKQCSPELKKALESVFNGGKAVDVALFGRMVADMPSLNQYAACQVAHSISTHCIEREFDFYTAIDDLQPEDNTGASMIGTIEFNSACFYRYSNVDMNKLLENLDGDRDLALKGLRTFIEGFVVATPTGKQNSFAAHNLPEFVAVSVRRSGALRNLVNAFETSIYVKTGESVTGKSAQKLIDKAMNLQSAFGGQEETFVLNLTEINSSEFGTKVGSLNELLDKAIALVKG